MQRIVHRTFADKIDNKIGNNKEVVTVDSSENSLADNNQQKSAVALQSDEQEIIAIKIGFITRYFNRFGILK